MYNHPFRYRAEKREAFRAEGPEKEKEKKEKVKM